MPPTPSRRVLPGVTAALAAVAMLLTGATGASAATTPFGTGLSTPAGAVLAPDGSWWVSDHLAGFCRLTAGGTIDSPTCLGGGLALRPGPAAPGTPAFHDPTPGAPNSGDELAYVPDSATGSRSVDRLTWSPATGTFLMKDSIQLTGAEPDQRPNVATLGVDGDLYVSTIRTTAIQRIVEPETDAAAAQVVGDVARVDGMAAGVDATGRLALYLSEPTGVTRLFPNAASPALSQPTNLDLGLAAPATPFTPGGLAFDPTTRVLYVGTASGAGPIDRVERFAIGGGLAGTTVGTGLQDVIAVSLGADRVAAFHGPVGDTQGLMALVDDPGVRPFGGPPPPPPPAPPAAASVGAPIVAPAVALSAVARVTRLSLTHRVSVRRLRRGGLRVTVRTAPGTTAVQIAIRRRGSSQTAVSLRRALRATARVHVLTLRSRAVRRLRAGRYTLSVTPIAADGQGPTTTAALRITG